MSIRAEKRLRAPDARLESHSVKKVSEQDKRFLKGKRKHHSPGSQRKNCLVFSCFLSSHLRRTRPPALFSEGNAPQAFSFSHPILPRGLVLPQSHRGRFVLQLGQVFHAAVNLQVSTTEQSEASIPGENSMRVGLQGPDLAKARGAG